MYCYKCHWFKYHLGRDAKAITFPSSSKGNQRTRGQGALRVKIGGTLDGFPLSAGAVLEVVEKLELGLSVGPDPDCDLRVVQEFFRPSFQCSALPLKWKKTLL